MVRRIALTASGAIALVTVAQTWGGAGYGCKDGPAYAAVIYRLRYR